MKKCFTFFFAVLGVLSAYSQGGPQPGTYNRITIDATAMIIAVDSVKEQDPTVNPDVKMLTSSDFSKWNDAYNFSSGYGNLYSLFPQIHVAYNDPDFVNQLRFSKIISFPGAASEYLRGDGSVATFPTIPSAQVSSDWNSTASPTQILNKPTIPSTTSQISEGTNLYYTATRFNTAFSLKSTSDLGEGTNQYFTTARARASFSAGAGVGISGAGVISNSSPDQTVTITPGYGVLVSGSYPNFTASLAKKSEQFIGTTNASGIYTVTYANTYSTVPIPQFQINGGTNKQTILLTSATTTGCAYLVQLRSDVLGLLPSYAPVSGATIMVSVFEQ